MAAVNFKFSRTLFISENGHPVTFYMRPCSERKRLKPMIEHGGGSVSSKQTKTCIKLLEPGGSVTTGGFIKSEFVLCCVKENKLVDMTKFRCVPGRVPSSDDDLSPARNIIRTQRPVKGRQKYTREDDWKIVSYLVRERRYNEVNGRKVWQDMELFEVSMHPGESMRTHYLKFILPNIKTYTNFPQHWVALLTGNTADATQVDRSKEIPKTSLVSSPGKSAQVRSPRTSAQVGSPMTSAQVGSPPKEVMETDDSIELSQSILNDYTSKTICTSPGKESSHCQYQTKPGSSRTVKDETLSIPPASLQGQSPYFSLIVNKNTQNHSDSSEVDEFDKNLLHTAMATACVDEDNRELEVFQEQSGPPKIHPENTPCSGNRKRTVTGGSTSNQETDSTDDEVSLRNPHHSASRTPCNTASDSKKMRGGNSRWRLEHCDTESQQSQEGDHSAADLLQAVEETCFHLKRFGKSLGLTLQEVLYALYINSGSEDDALHWIRFGVDTEGYPAWSQKDDEILLGTDEDNMVALEMKHGPKRLMSRRAFIEGI
ncbi:telomeric repeat-binding factor 2-interacting protein 1-like [Haliotis cracherodii]|uniref:telomeric repeat-binding factor 2-interacting protein 1-like n=1 Tax=Haliotis cracherodii TaxID=6455 RepID=UPI0039EB01FE